MSRFSDALDALLTAKGWTQTVFGEMAGLKQSDISTYVNGKFRPEPDKLRRILDAAGADDRELLAAYIQDLTPKETHSRISVEPRNDTQP